MAYPNHIKKLYFVIHIVFHWLHTMYVVSHGSAGAYIASDNTLPGRRSGHERLQCTY